MSCILNYILQLPFSSLLLSKTVIRNIIMVTNTSRHFHMYARRTGWQNNYSAGFHMQNMCDVIAKTLEYRSKYIHILNPTVRDDIR